MGTEASADDVKMMNDQFGANWRRADQVGAIALTITNGVHTHHAPGHFRLLEADTMKTDIIPDVKRMTDSTIGDIPTTVDRFQNPRPGVGPNPHTVSVIMEQDLTLGLPPPPGQ